MTITALRHPPSRQPPEPGSSRSGSEPESPRGAACGTASSTRGFTPGPTRDQDFRHSTTAVTTLSAHRPLLRRPLQGEPHRVVYRCGRRDAARDRRGGRRSAHPSGVLAAPVHLRRPRTGASNRRTRPCTRYTCARVRAAGPGRIPWRSWSATRQGLSPEGTSLPCCTPPTSSSGATFPELHARPQSGRGRVGAPEEEPGQLAMTSPQAKASGVARHHGCHPPPHSAATA
jgi:hypothetical protein